MKNIYKVTHYYAEDERESAFFLETELLASKMLGILAMIQFKFEELVDESMDIDTEDLINILERFYPIKDVTNDYIKYLPQTKLAKDEWNMAVEFIVEDIADPQLKKEFPIYQIDLYLAREYFCGDKFNELMQNKLWNSKEFINEILKAVPS